jgi:hypothetical protein
MADRRCKFDTRIRILIHFNIQCDPGVEPPEEISGPWRADKMPHGRPILANYFPIPDSIHDPGIQPVQFKDVLKGEVEKYKARLLQTINFISCVGIP